MLLSIISLIVLGLVLYSFIPLIRNIRLGNEIRCNSLAYLLFNLICSTEHLFFGFFNTVNMPLEIGLWTHQPRNILDWINLAQLVGVWALFICLFALNLYYNSAGRLSKALTILIYIGFLMISLMPLVVDATTDVFCPPDRPNCPEIDRDAIAMFEGLHSNLLLPFFTIILLVIGFYRQMRKPIQNLSLTGLKLQAAVFTLSAISWAFRLYFPWHLYHEDPRRSWPLYLILPAWYQGVGFVAFDDAAFALGQGILLYLALRQQRRAGAADAERQPLLAQGA